MKIKSENILDIAPSLCADLTRHVWLGTVMPGFCTVWPVLSFFCFGFLFLWLSNNFIRFAYELWRTSLSTYVLTVVLCINTFSAIWQRSSVFAIEVKCVGLFHSMYCESCCASTLFQMYVAPVLSHSIFEFLFRDTNVDGVANWTFNHIYHLRFVFFGYFVLRSCIDVSDFVRGFTAQC